MNEEKSDRRQSPYHVGNRPPRSLVAACRALYEGLPDVRKEDISDELNLPRRSWQKGEKWVKADKRIPDIAVRARELADKFDRKVEQLPPHMQADERALSEAERQVVDEFSVDVRAQVLDRHRKEWAAPRKIIYEAMKDAQANEVENAFNRGRLAKITSEVLTLIQNGECRAYGITPDARGDGKDIIVVERENGGS